MHMKTTNIGSIILGAEGSDQYMLVERTDGDDLTPKQAKEYLLPLVYQGSDTPGAYYCTTVRAVQVEHRADACICTVQHRYDV